MEWTVVLVITALVGLGAAVIKPIVSLTNSISAAVERLEEKLDDLTDRNSKTHDLLFETQREHDGRIDNHDLQLADHERRITCIEGEGRKA